MPEPRKPPPTAPPNPIDQAVVVDARRLFQGSREVCIDHDGIRYRLRITRRNKLILQK